MSFNSRRPIAAGVAVRVCRALASRGWRDESLVVDGQGGNYVAAGDFTLRHAARGIDSAPGYRGVAAEKTASLRNQTAE